MPEFNVPTGNVGTLLRFRNAILRSVPSQVTTDWMMGQLSIDQPKTARNYLAEFRQLRLVDQDGKLTRIAMMLRSPDRFSEACRAILDEAYPRELREAFEGKKECEDEVVTFLVNKGKGLGTAKRMATFFEFLRKGVLQDAPTGRAPGSRRTGSPGPRTVRAPDPDPQPDPPTTEVEERTASTESEPQDDFTYRLPRGRFARLTMPRDVSDEERKRIFRHLEIDLLGD